MRSYFVDCLALSTPPHPAYRNPTPHLPYTLLRVGFRPTIAPGLKAKGVALAVSEFFSTPLPFGHKCVGGTQNWFTLLLGALFPHGPPLPIPSILNSPFPALHNLCKEDNSDAALMLILSQSKARQAKDTSERERLNKETRTNTTSPRIPLTS